MARKQYGKTVIHLLIVYILYLLVLLCVEFTCLFNISFVCSFIHSFIHSFIRSSFCLDKSLKFHDELDPVGDRKVMDEFLDMVARSNIPKPELFEKELQSNVRKQEIENAEENLQMERQKDKNFRMRPRKGR